jgi:single-strand DNA-binding protein
MSDGLNRATLVGNLGSDPELKMLSNGRAVLRMRLATSSSYLDANRVRQSRTEWHTVNVWGKRAEGLARFLGKGDRLCIEGEIRTRDWEDANTGTKRYSTEIHATNVVLCGGSRNSDDRSRGERGNGEYTGESYEPGGFEPEDDIPF